METIKKVWINALFFIITLVINTLGGLGLINGLSQKQISDMYPTLITPSPFTFGIWSIIYSLLILSIIVMIIKKDKNYYRKAINKISLLFRISCLFNIAWIISFSYIQIELSVLFILGLLITLTLICETLLNIHDNRNILLPLTFGLYAGWLFIATVVNIAASLVKLGWNGFGIADEIWASIILIIAIVSVILVLTKIRNSIFSLPIAWAYFGIYQALIDKINIYGEFKLLESISLIGIIVLLLIALIQFYLNRYSIIPKSN